MPTKMSTFVVHMCCAGIACFLILLHPVFLVVIEDEAGVSKGYGFVRFYDESEQNRAFEELDNSTGLGTKPIRVKPANNNPRQKFAPFIYTYSLFFERLSFTPSDLCLKQPPFHLLRHQLLHPPPLPHPLCPLHQQ